MAHLKHIVHEEKGSIDIFAMLYCLMVTACVVWTLFMGYKLFLQQQALSEVARRGILMMEMAGGMTSEIRDSIRQELAQRGLEQTVIRSDTPSPVAFRRDIELTLDYRYRFFQTPVTGREVFIPLGGTRRSISLKNPR